MREMAAMLTSYRKMLATGSQYILLSNLALEEMHAINRAEYIGRKFVKSMSNHDNHGTKEIT